MPAGAGPVSDASVGPRTSRSGVAAGSLRMRAALELLAHDVEEALLGAEVVVQRAGGDVGLAGDGRDARALEAVCLEPGDGGGEEAGLGAAGNWDPVAHGAIITG